MGDNPPVNLILLAVNQCFVSEIENPRQFVNPSAETPDHSLLAHI